MQTHVLFFVADVVFVVWAGSHARGFPEPAGEVWRARQLTRSHMDLFGATFDFFEHFPNMLQPFMVVFGAEKFAIVIPELFNAQRF